MTRFVPKVNKQAPRGVSPVHSRAIFCVIFLTKNWSKYDGWLCGLSPTNLYADIKMLRRVQLPFDWWCHHREWLATGGTPSSKSWQTQQSSVLHIPVLKKIKWNRKSPKKARTHRFWATYTFGPSHIPLPAHFLSFPFGILSFQDFRMLPLQDHSNPSLSGSLDCLSNWVW